MLIYLFMIIICIVVIVLDAFDYFGFIYRDPHIDI